MGRPTARALIIREPPLILFNFGKLGPHHTGTPSPDMFRFVPYMTRTVDMRAAGLLLASLLIFHCSRGVLSRRSEPRFDCL